MAASAVSLTARAVGCSLSCSAGVGWAKDVDDCKGCESFLSIKVFLMRILGWKKLDWLAAFACTYYCYCYCCC